MKYIIVGTNRPGSRSRMVANIIQKMYLDNNEKTEVVDLAELPMDQLRGEQYGKAVPDVFNSLIQKFAVADGLIIVCPEYNGSIPGALKYFIDFWKYPETFEYRPVCFVGLGGMFGGLRPVEHLQQVFGYRNAFQYPDRVFLTNVWKILDQDQANPQLGPQIKDPTILQLLQKQVVGFQKFTKALKDSGLHANKG